MSESRDGELVCAQCRTGLTTDDKVCWRCGCKNLQPGTKPKEFTEELLVKALGLKWPVDANGSPVVDGAACACSGMTQCAHHAAIMDMARRPLGLHDGLKKAYPNHTPFAVDPAWVEKVRQASKTATPPEIEAAKGSILRAYAILHDEMFNRAESWTGK